MMPGPYDGTGKYLELKTQESRQYQLKRQVEKLGESEPGTDERKERLMEACRDFEAVFIEMLLAEMRKTVPEGELFDGGLHQEFYEDMFDRELAERIASGRGMGLAEKMYRQLEDSL